MEDITELFKALSDTTRLRIVALLCIHGEVCVCNLAEALGEPEYKISRHLSVLKAADIVTARRDGTWMYYGMAEPRNDTEACVFECLRKTLSRHPMVKSDLARVQVAACD